MTFEVFRKTRTRDFFLIKTFVNNIMRYVCDRGSLIRTQYVYIDIRCTHIKCRREKICKKNSPKINYDDISRGRLRYEI